MVVDVPYQSLPHTLKALKVQVLDSLAFARDFVPEDLQTPHQIFKWLKPQLTFQNDPKNVEFLQSFQTLMKNGGRGDCDCFTIAGLSSCLVNDINPLWVALAGDSHLVPTHIYFEVYDRSKDKICAFDLTNRIYNFQRPYKFKQRLLFRL